ncbi:Xaa-Pro aminopeptidase [Bradyrhizobium sp. USDA 4486]
MQENVFQTGRSRALPFDAAKLDRLMEAAGLDVLVATSKHNVQYLLGAERAIFFDYMDAIGVSRYLPVLVYPKGAPQKSVYVGHRLETHQRAVAPPWVPQVRTESNGSVDAVTRAVDLIKDAGVPLKRVGVEMAFLPMDAGKALADALPGAALKDALLVLERLRAVKSADELAKLKTASERVIASSWR